MTLFFETRHDKVTSLSCTFSIGESTKISFKILRKQEKNVKPNLEAFVMLELIFFRESPEIPYI